MCVIYLSTLWTFRRVQAHPPSNHSNLVGTNRLLHFFEATLTVWIQHKLISCH